MGDSTKDFDILYSLQRQGEMIRTVFLSKKELANLSYDELRDRFEYCTHYTLDYMGTCGIRLTKLKKALEEYPLKVEEYKVFFEQSHNVLTKMVALRNIYRAEASRLSFLDIIKGLLPSCNNCIDAKSSKSRYHVDLAIELHYVELTKQWRSIDKEIIKRRSAINSCKL